MNGYCLRHKVWCNLLCNIENWSTVHAINPDTYKDLFLHKTLYEVPLTSCCSLSSGLLLVPVVSNCTGHFSVVDVLHAFFTQYQCVCCSFCLEGSLTNSLPLLVEFYSSFRMELKRHFSRGRFLWCLRLSCVFSQDPVFCFLSSCIICKYVCVISFDTWLSWSPFCSHSILFITIKAIFSIFIFLFSHLLTSLSWSSLLGP